MYNVKFYGMNDTLEFGQYKGNTVMSVANQDWNYFILMVGGADCASFSDEVKSYANEYRRLVELCRANNIQSTSELGRFLTGRNMGSQFPSLAGDVKFDDGSTLSNGVSPRVYRQLCLDLHFGKSTSGKRVVGFTPNYETRKSISRC